MFDMQENFEVSKVQHQHILTKLANFATNLSLCEGEEKALKPKQLTIQESAIKLSISYMLSYKLTKRASLL